MEKKTLSKPMKEILTRLEEFEYIKTVIFAENVILQVKVTKNLSFSVFYGSTKRQFEK